MLHHAFHFYVVYYIDMQPIMNATVLMSGAQFFADDSAINPYMDVSVPIDRMKAQAEHDSIRDALKGAGVTVIQVPPPADCQDGVYTANWALVKGDKAVMSRLPNARQAEEPYAAQILSEQSKIIVEVPDSLRFSGQGDALPCGNYLLSGSGYRTDVRSHDFIRQSLGYEVISLQTVPQLDGGGKPQINSFSGWPDSFFYDIDLAISVLKPDLIAWCPEAFMPESQEKIQALPLNKIEVSIEEAVQGYACNLVSTGKTVVMSDKAPNLKAAIEAHGLKTITPPITELLKGGGYIRCTTLTLSN
jgi:N-dimethylarginine dimethylaminohydrolase